MDSLDDGGKILKFNTKLNWEPWQDRRDVLDGGGEVGVLMLAQAAEF